MASLSRLFLRTRGMGILRSRLNPAAPLPILGGGGGSNVLVRLGQVRSLSNQTGLMREEKWAPEKEYGRVYLWGMRILFLGLCWTTAFKTPDWRREVIHLETTARAKKYLKEDLSRRLRKSK